MREAGQSEYPYLFGLATAKLAEAHQEYLRLLAPAGRDERGGTMSNTHAPTKPTKKIVYRLNVYVTMPLTDDPQHPDFYTEEQATSTENRRGLERSLFNWLKRFGDADVELMDFSVEED